MKNTPAIQPLPAVIGHWNKHLFPAEMQAAFDYFDANDEPTNPDKAGDSLEFTFKRKWKQRIAQSKADDPSATFKSIAVAMILDMDEAWPDWEVEAMVAWAWKVFSMIKTSATIATTDKSVVCG